MQIGDAQQPPISMQAVHKANERGERTVWLEEAMADRLGAMRGPEEDYSAVILRLWAANERA